MNLNQRLSKLEQGDGTFCPECGRHSTDPHELTIFIQGEDEPCYRSSDKPACARCQSKGINLIVGDQETVNEVVKLISD